MKIVNKIWYICAVLCILFQQNLMSMYASTWCQAAQGARTLGQRYLSTAQARNILKVSENASAAEINRAYKARAFECHPDVAKNISEAEATAKMKELNAARDALLNKSSGESSGQANSSDTYSGSTQGSEHYEPFSRWKQVAAATGLAAAVAAGGYYVGGVRHAAERDRITEIYDQRSKKGFTDTAKLLQETVLNQKKASDLQALAAYFLAKTLQEYSLKGIVFTFLNPSLSIENLYKMAMGEPRLIDAAKQWYNIQLKKPDTNKRPLYQTILDDPRFRDDYILQQETQLRLAYDYAYATSGTRDLNAATALLERILSLTVQDDLSAKYANAAHSLLKSIEDYQISGKKLQDDITFNTTI